MPAALAYAVCVAAILAMGNIRFPFENFRLQVRNLPLCDHLQQKGCKNVLFCQGFHLSAAGVQWFQTLLICRSVTAPVTAEAEGPRWHAGADPLLGLNFFAHVVML